MLTSPTAPSAVDSLATFLATTPVRRPNGAFNNGTVESPMGLLGGQSFSRDVEATFATMTEALSLLRTEVDSLGKQQDHLMSFFDHFKVRTRDVCVAFFCGGGGRRTG